MILLSETGILWLFAALIGGFIALFVPLFYFSWRSKRDWQLLADKYGMQFTHIDRENLDYYRIEGKIERTPILIRCRKANLRGAAGVAGLLLAAAANQRHGPYWFEITVEARLPDHVLLLGREYLRDQILKSRFVTELAGAGLEFSDNALITRRWLSLFSAAGVEGDCQFVVRLWKFLVNTNK